MKLIDKVLSRYERARARKAQSDSLRAEAGKYVWPTAQRQARSAFESEGLIQTETLYDSTALMAAYKMTSGIFSYLMPVGTKWFEFVASPHELNNDKTIQEWLSAATAITHQEIWRSNFQREMFITIRSMIVFGTGVLSVEMIDNDMVFKSHHIGYMSFDDNNRGEIDTVFRQIFYTARQAYQEFGDGVSKSIKKALDAGQLNERFEFVHACGPNEDFDSSKLNSTNKKIRSLYICIEDREIVKDGGFDEMPYFVARFSRAPQEIMGRGPAIEMLPEIKMLNRMKKTFIESAEKAVNPPIMVEDDGVVGQPVTSPGGLIYVRPGAMEPKPLNTGMNVQLNAELIAQQQEVVREAFFNDLFQARAQHRNMTATEVVERVEEKIVHLAPAITALQKEIFSPLIKRVFNLLSRARKIEPPPIETDFEVIYQGRLALAMSNMQTNAIEATLAKWAPYAQIADIFSNVDFDTAFRTSWLNAGAPAEGLKDYDQMMAEREEAKQLQMASAQAQIADDASKAYRNVSKAPDPNSLAAAMQGMRLQSV